MSQTAPSARLGAFGGRGWAHTPLGPPRLRKCQPSEKVHVAFPYLEPLFRPSHYVFLLWVKH